MHPLFVTLFIETDADLLAEEQDRKGTRRQASQEHRAFPQADALPRFHAGGTSVLVVAGQ
jgi:hypothetical protein